MRDSGEGFQFRQVREAGKDESRPWGIAVEVPVEVRLNGSSWVVMLATPTDLEDLAVGLAVSERLIDSAADLAGVVAAEWLGEWSVDLKGPADRIREPARSGRTMAGNSGCGLCGLESLASLHAHRGQHLASHERSPVTDAAIEKAFAALPSLQPINAATRSVHAAAWCALDGAVQLVREDVGRHNALDKVVGALARGGRLAEPGFLVLTSRCSYELVAKASVTAAHLLATISAPTTLALAWSESLGVPLACLGPGRAVIRFPREVANVAR